MNRKGFTLIELLIVVVIIGILAAIAIPKFANTKQKAVLASMKSDARNMVTAQEAYFGDNSAFAPAIGNAQAAGVAAFTPSKGNVIAPIVATATGWSAVVTNPAVTSATPNTCAVFVGDATPPGTAPANQPEGSPYCY
jgi:prepilin-type N-terminal cleavage/methylation domain-containing protein